MSKYKTSPIWNAYENRWQAAQEAMNFSRQLERELAAMTAERDALSRAEGRK